MPTHNRAHIVGKAIQSILDQTYQDFEFIIVNDASNDNTEEVVKGFTDERIRYTRMEKSPGTSAAARNTGIRMARGKYIAQQDDDTIWNPEKLAKQVKVMDAAPPEVGIVYTGFLIHTDARNHYLPEPYILEREGNIFKQVLKGEGFSTNPPILARRECYERLGLYDEELPSMLDWDMWIRMAKHYQVRLIDEPLVTTHYSPSTSHYNEMAFIKGFIAVLDKHFNEYIETDKELLARSYFERGLSLCLMRDAAERAEGRKYVQKAFRLSPLRLRHGMGVIASWLGLTDPYIRALNLPSKVYARLRPLFDYLRPVMGWAYPFLKRLWLKFC